MTDHVTGGKVEADEYEKRIREKVWASECLSAGEWVYLVGLFQMARDVEGGRPAQIQPAWGGWTPDQFWEYVEGLTDTYIRDCMRDMLASRGLSFASAKITQWQPIETAPKEPEAMFLVCAVGDDRGAFVVRADIMWQARKAGTPHHLGLSHLTHWMPLPEGPALPSTLLGTEPSAPASEDRTDGR